MLNYIIPPIVIVLSLAALIFFVFRKSSEISKELISEEKRKLTARPDSKKRKLFRFTQVILKVTEKGMQYFKLFSLKFYNKFDSWFHSVKEKREKRIDVAEEIKEEIPAVPDQTRIIVKEEKRVVIDNIKIIEKEPEIKPMVSSEMVHPESKGEVKSEFERALIERIALNPKDIEAYERLGDYYIEIGNFNDSLACFDQVLKLSPANRRAKIKAKRLQKIVFTSLGE